MSPRFPRFYPILDSALRPGLSATDTTHLLTLAGVRLLQLRAKQASSRDLLALAEEFTSLLPAGCMLIVNDRADVAALARAAGVHLGQFDLPPDAARAIVGPDGIVGFSTHDQEQLTAPAATAADYLAFGPVFPTTSKKDPDAAVGLEGLRKARRLTAKPLVAIGGITPRNAAQVMDAGADSVAAISGWLATDDIPRRLREYKAALGGFD